MNQSVLKKALKYTDNSFSDLRKVIGNSKMELVIDNYQRAQEIATELKKGESPLWLAKLTRPQGNNSGMYEDFRTGKMAAYPDGDRLTANQNNVIDKISKLKNEDLPDYDTLTMRVFDILEDSKVISIASARGSMEYINESLNRGENVDKIVDSFIDKRNLDGSIDLANDIF